MAQKSSFIAICGAPNAGKSSIVNYFVGTKVTIVSPRPQTTRVNVKGIATIKDTQLVFVDTPGIMNAHDDRQKKMVENAWHGISDVDQIVFVNDAQKGMTELSETIINNLKGKNPNTVAVINKTDLVPHEELFELAQKIYDTGVFKEVFMTSVNKEKGLDALKDYLIKNSPEAPFPFPDDQISDTNDRFIAEEITREKIFYLMREEVPYGVDIETVQYKDNGEKGIVIHQNVFVSRPSHKKIIIGDNAAMIKQIGQQARNELTKLLGQKVHLFLHVKVAKGGNAVE